MAYGKISEAFWHDAKIRNLSERARYFMLYLMSCPHGNRLGLFVLDLGYAASDLSCGVDVATGEAIKWEPLHVSEVLTELQDRGRVGWDVEDRVVFVRHYIRHNTMANLSVVKGALNDLLGLPDTPLLAELLEAVREQRRGPAGPTKSYMTDLEDELVRRLGIIGIPTGNIDESHSVVHGAGHGAIHGATQSRARTPPSQPYRTLPSRSLPSLTDPTLTDRDEHGGEDDINLEQEITDALPMARAHIVRIHGGTEDPVTIGKHKVGVGIEINAFRDLCRTGVDPPHIIASAIAHLPDVTKLGTPVSLARWGWDAEDGPAIYEQCVGEAYKALPSVDLPDVRMNGPSETDVGDRKRELREQLDTLRERAVE